MFKLLILLGRFRWLLLVLPIGMGAIALASSYALPLQFRTTVIIAGSKEVPAAVLKSLVESDGVRDRLIASLELAKHFGTTDVTTAQRIFSQRVSARPGRDGLLFVTVTDQSPEFAAKLADAVAAETIRSAHASRLTVNSQELARLRLRLDTVNRETAAADAQLRALGVTDWRTALPDADRTSVALLMDLQAEIDFAGRRSQGAQSAFILQEQMLSIQRSLLDRRTSGTATLAPAVFDLIRGQYFRLGLVKRLEQELIVVANDRRDELKPIAPAPVPVDKDSPKRLMLAAAGFAFGLALAFAIALTIGSGAATDPARAARLGTLKRAWGLQA